MKVYIDGKFVDEDDACISIFDYGFLYGYGIFEDIRAYNGRIFRLNEHLDRLWLSAKCINLPISASKKEIEKLIIKTLLINNLLNSYIKLIITKGSADNSNIHSNKYIKDSSIIIITNFIKLYDDNVYENGVKISTSFARKQSRDLLTSNVKSLNQLDNVIVKENVFKNGFFETIILNKNGCVIGCSNNNIFFIKEGILYTPSKSEISIVGITRNIVIELAKNKLKISVKETRVSIYDIYMSDECFFTSTFSEIIPVIMVDSNQIANGNPGHITLKLIKEFKNFSNLTGTPII
jgi:branched-chain amino acid aminotransferase